MYGFPVMVLTEHHICCGASRTSRPTIYQYNLGKAYRFTAARRGRRALQSFRKICQPKQLTQKILQYIVLYGIIILNKEYIRRDYGNFNYDARGRNADIGTRHNKYDRKYFYPSLLSQTEGYGGKPIAFRKACRRRNPYYRHSCYYFWGFNVCLRANRVGDFFDYRNYNSYFGNYYRIDPDLLRYDKI